MLNRAIHAQRAASMDPYLQDVAPEKANVVRVGYGRGEEVADGNWSEAVRIPSTPTLGRRRRVDSLSRRSASHLCSAPASRWSRSRRCCCGRG